MNARSARDLGAKIAVLLEAGQPLQAYTLLAPVLAARTPFLLLGHIGAAIDAAPVASADAFLDRIAAERTEGGWVVIATALGARTARDPAGAFARCRAFIAAANVWYAADIFGERVPGPALVATFQPALALLAPWRADANGWVRRTAGVAVHFWAKRARGAPKYRARARRLLAFLEPVFEEQDPGAIKGIGWGLKTLGRYYPDLVADWLARQLGRGRRPRALMLRKAVTYLSPGQRAHATAAAQD